MAEPTPTGNQPTPGPGGSTATPAAGDEKAKADEKAKVGDTAQAKETKFGYFVRTWPAISSFAIGALGVGLGIVIMWGLFSPHSIVRELGNADLARGVITFIFAIGTIGIALLVALGALIGDHDDTKLGRAKEVLTVLIGIFGTILGFYFGTAANGNAQKLEIAEMKIADKQVMTHVTGGTPPYRFSITSSENEFKPMKDQVSSDGWITPMLDNAPKTGKITVDVSDSRDVKGTREQTLSSASPARSPKVSPTPVPAGASPSPTPKPGTPTPTSTPAQ
jgi:hypothetical protein